MEDGENKLKSLKMRYGTSKQSEHLRDDDEEEEDDKESFNTSDVLKDTNANEENEKLSQELNKVQLLLIEMTNVDEQNRKEISTLRTALQEKNEFIKNHVEELPVFELNKNENSPNPTIEVTEFEAKLKVNEEKLKQLTIELENKNLETKKYKEEISQLKASLENSKKIEQKLEGFLTIETAKNKKVEAELEFVIKSVNKEKEDLFKTFEEFQRDGTTPNRPQSTVASNFIGPQRDTNQFCFRP